MAAWFIVARERKDAAGKPVGIYNLVASQANGNYHIGCDHNHPTQKEAQECLPARKELSTFTSIPLERIA